MSTQEQFVLNLRQAANALAQNLGADVLVYNGRIDSPLDQQMIDLCRDMETLRENAFLVMVTYGGSAHAAYRMARCLQRHYSKVTLCVPAVCASAGTLFAIGAHELAVADHGSLGPLDVQIRKTDELYETTSGLTTIEALETLRSESFQTFEANLLDLKERLGGITLRTAMETAEKLTTDLFKL